MYLCDVNPYIRFASRIHYTAERNRVKVTDCRIFSTIAGQAKLHIKNKTYALYPGSLFYCCAGSEYTIEAPAGVDLISLNFDLTQNQNHQSVPFPPRSEGWDEMPVNLEHIQDSELLGEHFYTADGALCGSVQKIAEEFGQQQPYFRELASSMLKHLLLRLHRLSTPEVPEKIRQVKEFMDEHFAVDISNKQLAAMAGYHEYYLNRVFQNHTGMSLHEYLLKVRLSRASYLILNTDLPLKALPEQVGFHSYPHFSGYFKQHFGLSPADYRKTRQRSI